MPEITFSEIILFLLLLANLAISYLERKDLQDRLMAKSLEDYKVNTQQDEPNTLPEEKDETIPLEEAQSLIEEDYANTI